LDILPLRQALPFIPDLVDVNAQGHFLLSLHVFYHSGNLGCSVGLLIPPTTANMLEVIMLGWELEYVDPNALHYLLSHYSKSLWCISFSDMK
jgi:hypothetical protein